MAIQMTAGEKKFLMLAKKASELNGGDFACTCDIKVLSGKQISGYVSSLVKKGIISSTETQVNNDYTVYQITFNN